MNINDMYQICQYAINKAQNGYLTPSQFNLIANQAQISYQDYLMGAFQQYQIGRPQSRVSYSQNRDTRQRLIPFIKEVTLSVNGSGFSAYPTNYLQTDAVRTIANNRIRFVQPDRLYSFLNSQIDPVSSNPIYIINDNGFQFYPITLGSAILDYIIIAPDVFWAYTLDVNNRPIYNPSLSIQPLWYDIDKLEIIARILKLVGINLQDGQIQQYANQVVTQGQ